MASASRGNEDFLFHGTRRACLVGEDGRQARPCSSKNCFLCSIIQHSFDISRSGMRPVPILSVILINDRNHRINKPLSKVLFPTDVFSLLLTWTLGSGPEYTPALARPVRAQPKPLMWSNPFCRGR